jgi:predicted outer membrane repeat protein
MKLTKTIGKMGGGKLAIALVAVLPFACGATTFYVKPDGSDSNNGTSWETAFKTPKKGFDKIHGASENHEVVIAAGTYILTEPCRCAGPLANSGKRVVVRGATGNPADVVLKGNDTFEIIRLSRCVTVADMTISNGSNSNRTDRAAGIRVGATDAGVSIASNCIITACYNAYTNGTKTTDNKALYGGPLYVYQNGLAVDCVVSNNSSIFYGCGVTLDGENATALRCRIEGNVATNTDNSGVAVFGVNGENTHGGRMIDCVVQSNLTAYCAGARNVLWVEGCTFRGNVLDPNAVTAHSSSAMAIGVTGVIVTNCTFVDNRADSGYATIYVTQRRVNILDSRFIGNRVSTYGGAISFNIGSVSAFSSVSNCLFVSNGVATSSSKGGGAIRIDAGCVALANCTFNGNTASRGGAMDIVGSTANSTIVSCTNCVFTENQVYANGGAVRSSYAAQVRFDDCHFVSNNTPTSSDTYGGAISVNQARDGGTCIVLNSMFADNSATTYGGALDAVVEDVGDDAHLVCSNCVFSGNTAGKTGGGVRMTKYTRAILDDCRFVNNATTTQGNGENYGGGAILLYMQQAGGICAISNCVFAGNVSGGRGGAIASTWNGVCFCEIANCVFTNNSSCYQGGAVSFRERSDHDHPFSIRNSLFAFNRTTCADGSDSSGGGLVLVTSNDVEIANCTIVSNTSAYTKTAQSGGVHQRWGGRYVNCIIAYNLTKSGASQDGNWTDARGSFVNCCAWPNTTTHMTAANGCINVDPLFADAANGDFTLRPNSPCRNAGLLEGWMEGATDLAGSPRVSGKGVDIGCYEFFVPSGLFIIFQ